MTDANTTDRHVPVMLGRIVELLSPALVEPGSIFVDGTLGLGGHTEALLRACPNARVIGLDRDPQAIAHAEARLAPFGDRVTIAEVVYDQLAEVLADLGITQVQAVLLDLGLSSLQIDRPERGFAYAADAPLDMRMDGEQGLTAAEVVNTYSERDLARLFKHYGDEKFADRIARAIVRQRDTEPFTHSARLVEVIREALPAAARFAGSGGHPGKRIFQALRIEVNAEFDALDEVLPQAIDALAPGGRLAVLAYHSGEDRRVKQVLRAAAESRAPRDLPVVPAGMGPQVRLLTRGAEQPEPDEIADNPRAASARLRAAEKVADQ
ncbi:16S rRNA (cytosine(1402)-N(4))-methyltransferase RsmH [Enemella sp. A6]|uniref:16S rRNA (cytosine(1402)-N(4))-methyltransferase RsmH n=1 Tax=Enemella sp. A6 TaxID=3440152 RepID=UPI003EBECB6A